MLAARMIPNDFHISWAIVAQSPTASDHLCVNIPHLLLSELFFQIHRGSTSMFTKQLHASVFMSL